MILVTGGSGFIGANFIHHWLTNNEEELLNLDNLSYAANQDNLSEISSDKRYCFVQGSITELDLVVALLNENEPRALINFAAESHVDRSIENPDKFVSSNINGTHTLLKAALSFWEGLNQEKKEKFRYIQISTDEVYGSLNLNAPKSIEADAYLPNSPYSASKASGDHLVRAWHETYQFPAITTNCTNNYGPFQHEEKLIPLMIKNCLEGKELPLYGDGKNIRDWLFVKDHCEALELVLSQGIIGETYNIGGNNELSNIQVVEKICELLDELKPKEDKKSYREQITFVEDRKGHDFRYGLDISKITNALGWTPTENFDSGLRKTVEWYLNKLKS